jgi:hypothetical protein
MTSAHQLTSKTRKSGSTKLGRLSNHESSGEVYLMLLSIETEEMELQLEILFSSLFRQAIFQGV